MTSTEEALLIFIKNPVKGKVKTRLAKTLGDDEALNIYQKLLSITQTQTMECNCARYLFYSDSIDTTDNWQNNHYLKHIQIGDDLGERMLHAFEFAFKLGHSKVIIIGSDCPTIDTQLLNTALDQLNHKEVIIGPSEDGGYYLLGMNKLASGLFENMPWSQPHLFKQSLQFLKQNQISYHLLPVLNDIDTEEDWERYLSSEKFGSN